MHKPKNISTATSLLQKQLDSFFKQEKKDTKELLYKISLLMYQSESPDTDIYNIHHIIDSDTISRLINYYDGKPINLPDKKKWKECLIMVISYYFKYVKNMKWNEIKKMLHIPVDELKVNDSISIGLKLKSFTKKIQIEFEDAIRNLEDKEVIKALKEFLTKDNVVEVSDGKRQSRGEKGKNNIKYDR